ncbi:MAG TPA: hypothetical protein VK433_01055 [Stellaceae bacterium]|nr:hypothetical protein [Stellaceae bacterium]
MLRCLLLAVAVTLGLSGAARAEVKGLISDEQISKIVAMLDEHGKEVPLDPYVTEALGLTKDGVKISPRQIAVRDDEGLIHAFIRLDKGGGYLFGRVAEPGVLVIRVSADWKLVSAILKSPGRPETAKLPRPEAQQGYEEELKHWAKIADEL